MPRTHPSISELFLIAVIVLSILFVCILVPIALLTLSLAKGTILLLILCRKLVLSFAGSFSSASIAVTFIILFTTKLQFLKIYLLSIPVKLVLIRSHNVFANCIHKFFIFSHLFQSFADALEDQQIWEARTQLKELFEIFVLVCFFSDSILLEHPEKVFTFNYVKCLLLSL